MSKRAIFILTDARPRHPPVTSPPGEVSQPDAQGTFADQEKWPSAKQDQSFGMR